MQDSGLEGVLLVDKAKGSSSFQVVSKVRRALGTRAVGHVGTLDPLASGLLVFLIGRYTRLSNYLMAGSKHYRATIELGTSTTTDDKEGEIVDSAPAEHITKEHILLVLSEFLGKQQQVPPTFSAISVNGVRSYRRARAGENFEMQPRQVEVEDISFVALEHQLLTIDVSCSKGTYIRSLARDIGGRLDVPAHLADLRRTRCSSYDIGAAIAEDDLGDSDLVKSHLQKGLDAILGLEVLNISDDDARRLRSGQRVKMLSPHDDSGIVYLAALENEPVALCRIDNSELLSVRGF